MPGSESWWWCQSPRDPGAGPLAPLAGPVLTTCDMGALSLCGLALGTGREMLSRLGSATSEAVASPILRFPPVTWKALQKLGPPSHQGQSPWIQSHSPSWRPRMKRANGCGRQSADPGGEQPDCSVGITALSQPFTQRLFGHLLSSLVSGALPPSQGLCFLYN